MNFFKSKWIRKTALAGALALSLAGKLPAEELSIKNDTKQFSSEVTASVTPSEENPYILKANLDASAEYTLKDGNTVSGGLKIENGLPTKAFFATGNDNCYLGAKLQNLSNETTLLKDANLFKIEGGVINAFNFLDLSAFIAETTMPNMKKRSFWLLTFGLEGTVKPEIKIKDGSLTPWLYGKILFNIPGLLSNYQDPNGFDNSSLTWALNHFNAGLGIDLNAKNFKLSLENYVDGGYLNFYYAPYINTIHKLKASIGDRNNFLEYAFKINPIIRFYVGAPTDINLESEVNFKFSSPFGLYLKGMVDINHKFLEDSNLIAALGYSDKNGINAELFYNLQNKTLGLTLSLKEIGNNKEKYSKKSFVKINNSPDPNLYLFDGGSLGDVSLIHSIYGNDVSDVIKYIKNKSTDYISAITEIARYASYFKWENHTGTFTAEQEHDLGYGVCRDTNGNLLPAVINGVLGDKGYKSWGTGFHGPYLAHDIIVIQKPDGRIDLMDYNFPYFIDAKTTEEAIDIVYPGLSIYDGGRYSETSQRIISALEESVWK